VHSNKKTLIPAACLQETVDKCVDGTWQVSTIRHQTCFMVHCIPINISILWIIKRQKTYKRCWHRHCPSTASPPVHQKQLLKHRSGHHGRPGHSSPRHRDNRVYTLAWPTKHILHCSQKLLGTK